MKAANAPASASEADTYRQCPRRWAFRYRWDEGPRVARQAYFTVGTKFDKLVENYWKFGIVPSDPNDSLTQLFMVTIPIIPGPGQHRNLQLRDTWYLDSLPIQTVPDYLGTVGDLDLCGDLKTTKDIKAYSLLTKDQKLDNMQTVMYAYRYLPNGGVFDHWYAQKHRAIELQYEDKILDKDLARKLGKKHSTAPIQPKATGSAVVMTRAEIVTAFERVALPACEKVYQLRQKHARINPLTLDLPVIPEDPKDSPCEAYGGCEYKATCFPRGDLRGANVQAHYTDIRIRPATAEVSVKFKIQKPDAQIEIPTTETAVISNDQALTAAFGKVPAPEQTKKFSPFKRTETHEPPTKTEMTVKLSEEDQAAAQALVLSANELAALEQAEAEGQVTPIVPEFESPAMVDLEVDEPTLSVEDLVKQSATALESEEKTLLLKEIFTGRGDNVGFEMQAGEEMELEQKIGRAVLDLLALLGLNR
jgi:hypothetical protein